LLDAEGKGAHLGQHELFTRGIEGRAVPRIHQIDSECERTRVKSFEIRRIRSKSIERRVSGNIVIQGVRVTFSKLED
jgi:hypothetical protein